MTNGLVPARRGQADDVHHSTCAYCKEVLWTAQPAPALRRRTYMKHVVRAHSNEIPSSRDRALLADVMLHEEKQP